MFTWKDVLLLFLLVVGVIIYAGLGAWLTSLLGCWFSIIVFLGAFCIPFIMIKIIMWWVEKYDD